MINAENGKEFEFNNEVKQQNFNWRRKAKKKFTK